MVNKSEILFLTPYSRNHFIYKNKNFTSNIKFAGGAELQSSFIAKLLSRKYKVGLITFFDEILPFESITTIDGVKLYPVLYPILNNLFKKIKFYIIIPIIYLNKINPKIIYIRSNSIYYFSIIIFKLFKSNTSLYIHISSDSEIQTIKFLRKIIYKLANKIICQSDFQKRKLSNNYGNKIYKIPNFILSKYITKNSPKKYDVIWVGNVYPFKNPKLIKILVEKYNHLNFIIIGVRVVENKYHKLFEEFKLFMKNKNNVEFYDFLYFDELNELFKKTKIYINTSEIEGFPNTFLQAWANGCAILSLKANPDDIIRKSQGGLCAYGYNEKFFDFFELLVKNDNLSANYAKNGLNFVKENFTENKISQEIFNIFS